MRLPTFAAAVFALALAGCAETPSPECNDYVACFDAYVDAGGTDANPQEMVVYRPEGACWTAPASAYDCTQMCTAQLTGLANDYRGLDVGDPPPECIAE